MGPLQQVCRRNRGQLAPTTAPGDPFWLLLRCCALSGSQVPTTPDRFLTSLRRSNSGITPSTDRFCARSPPAARAHGPVHEADRAILRMCAENHRSQHVNARRPYRQHTPYSSSLAQIPSRFATCVRNPSPGGGDDTPKTGDQLCMHSPHDGITHAITPEHDVSTPRGLACQRRSTCTCTRMR
jgi:hypothetical protein